MLIANKRDSSSSLPTVKERFFRFVSVLESCYDLRLPIPDVSSCGELGKFCTTLVEGGSHPWRPIIAGLGAQSRFGIAHSLFLFRKVIPKDKPRIVDYCDKMASTQDAPDEEFLLFAKKFVSRMFRPGWDSSYRRNAARSHFSMSASAESPRSEGGGRGLDPISDHDRAEFCEYVLMASGMKPRVASVVQAVETGGKWRVISSPPRIDNALRAFHHTLYDYLSQFRWLLRGDAKPSQFKDFVPKEGEVFVSGDYESATDNLNSELQRQLMGVIFDACHHVPLGIQEHALATYSSELRIGRDNCGIGATRWYQHRGQLMGQLTSFPMLCLVNYVTFRYSCWKMGLKSLPVRVNGDDIVFRGPPQLFDNWGRDVERGGLLLSKGKTLVHRRGFTLNSVPFWAMHNGPKVVGFIRSSAIWKDKEAAELIRTLKGRYFSCCQGYGSQRRALVRTLFLRENTATIMSSRRSVTRGLEMSCGRKELTDSGLWFRELFYLELPEELPLPPVWGSTPPGWVKEPTWRFTASEVRAWERLYSSACNDHHWLADHSDPCFYPCSTQSGVSTGPGAGGYGDKGRPLGSPGDFEAHREGRCACGPRDDLSNIRFKCPSYGLPPGKKYRRMLGMSRRQAWDWACRRRNESYFGRVRFKRKGEDVWVLKDRSYNGILIANPRFVDSKGNLWAGSAREGVRVTVNSTALLSPVENPWFEACLSVTRGMREYFTQYLPLLFV